MYGAGNLKLGNIVDPSVSKEAQKKRGAADRKKFFKAFPALKILTDRVKSKATKTKKLKGLDGRMVPAESGYLALNRLCQSAGAIVMKRALVICDEACKAEGWTPGKRYEFVVNVHDEWQAEVDEDKTQSFGEISKQAIVSAGEYYNMRCPLDGEYKIGESWKETH